MSVMIGGLEIPIWKTLLTISLAGFAILGTETRAQVYENRDDIVTINQEKVRLLTVAEEVSRRLKEHEDSLRRIEDKLGTTPSSSYPAFNTDPVRQVDLSPIIQQLNRMEKENAVRDASQDREIKRILDYLTARRNQ